MNTMKYEGQKEKQMEIAAFMLKKLPIDISRATGLTEEKINELQTIIILES